MIHLSTNEEGFTAIELLITLIVASIFLFSGYQLYVQVTRDGADANKTAVLSNVVYERMTKLAKDTTSLAGNQAGCGTTSISTPAATVENVAGVGSVTFQNKVRCPRATTPGNLTDLFYIEVEATYTDGGVSKQVRHATYAS